MIQQQLPKLRQVRVHLDLTTNELKNLKLTLWVFKGLTKLPNLQLFRLELHQRIHTGSTWAKGFMESMQAALIYKFLQFVGGNFEVDIQLIEKKGWMFEMPEQW